MKADYLLLLPVIFPVLAGILLTARKVFDSRKLRMWFVITASALELVFVLAAAAGDYTLVLFSLSDRLVFVLHPDKLSFLFGVLCAVMWLLSSVYAADYMRHDKGERFYQTFFLISVGVIVAVCFSANLPTMYLFYEMMTLMTLPFVIHDRTKEAIQAGFQYLLYSVGGAFLGLAAFFIFYSCGIDLDFVAGGSITAELAGEHRELLLIGCFLAVAGFGSKAGMFPLHGWLPAAHPVAPAPASALLSGNVTKMGVLFIIRILYYVAGPEFVHGTWVQYTFITLTLITVFLGSVIASREKQLKKRLAYSTVSQVSYALFGIALLHPVALCGALLHVVFHSAVKNTLFLSAGAVIHQTGHTRTDELRGIGKQMPVTMWLYTLVSLTLIGIPPTSAFLSKWYLAQGALNSGIAVVEYAGPVILLISAVFTAAYLLSVTVQGFFPGREEDGAMQIYEKREASWFMLAPMLVLTIAAVGLGMFPGRLLEFINAICSQVV